MDFVNSILRQYLNPGDSIDSVISKPRPVAKKVAEAVSSGSSDFEFPDTMTTSPDAPASTSSSADSDDLDSFLDEIGI